MFCLAVVHPPRLVCPDCKAKFTSKHDLRIHAEAVSQACATRGLVCCKQLHRCSALYACVVFFEADLRPTLSIFRESVFARVVPKRWLFCCTRYWLCSVCIHCLGAPRMLDFVRCTVIQLHPQAPALSNSGGTGHPRVTYTLGGVSVPNLNRQEDPRSSLPRARTHLSASAQPPSSQTSISSVRCQSGVSRSQLGAVQHRPANAHAHGIGSHMSRAPRPGMLDGTATMTSHDSFGYATQQDLSAPQTSGVTSSMAGLSCSAERTDTSRTALMLALHQPFHRHLPMPDSGCSYPPSFSQPPSPHSTQPQPHNAYDPRTNNPVSSACTYASQPSGIATHRQPQLPYAGTRANTPDHAGFMKPSSAAELSQHRQARTAGDQQQIDVPRMIPLAMCFPESYKEWIF